jgi:demethylmenaquinone methyltransferase/2-methoxy-6-polyprenyl-1,4-benzoquinol methylase
MTLQDPLKMTNPDQRTQGVKSMFDLLAPTYDLLNRLLSFGVDVSWRRKTVARLPKGKLDVLDLACGTGDVSLEVVRQRPQAAVCGADLSLGMLKAGVPKIKKRKCDDAISLQALSAEDLPYKDDSFDAVTIAFGIRNVSRRDKALTEMVRVLRPGGKALILDFSMPPNPLMRALYGFYFHRALPLIGGLVSGNFEAYKYLPNSVAGFPPREEFVELMRASGFKSAEWTDFTFGVSTLYEGRL